MPYLRLITQYPPYLIQCNGQILHSIRSDAIGINCGRLSRVVPLRRRPDMFHEFRGEQLAFKYNEPQDESGKLPCPTWHGDTKIDAGERP